MSKIKNGLDQYGAEPFQQQQFGTAGVEGVNDFYIQLLQLIAHFGTDVQCSALLHCTRTQ